MTDAPSTTSEAPPATPAAATADLQYTEAVPTTPKPEFQYTPAKPTELDPNPTPTDQLESEFAKYKALLAEWRTEDAALQKQFDESLDAADRRALEDHRQPGATVILQWMVYLKKRYRRDVMPHIMRRAEAEIKARPHPNVAYRAEQQRIRKLEEEFLVAQGYDLKDFQDYHRHPHQPHFEGDEGLLQMMEKKHPLLKKLGNAAWDWDRGWREKAFSDAEYPARALNREIVELEKKLVEAKRIAKGEAEPAPVAKSPAAR